VTKLAAALAFLALNFYTYHYMAREAVVPPREVFAGFPMTLEGWSCSEQGTVDPEVWRGLGATDLFLCGYSNEEEGAHVSVYVGYHATQIREEGGGAGENSIHPPAHCLPGAGWDIIDNQTVALQIPELPTQDGRAKRLIVAKGEARQLVYYWYQSRGRVIAPRTGRRSSTSAGIGPREVGPTARSCDSWFRSSGATSSAPSASSGRSPSWSWGSSLPTCRSRAKAPA
jgi:EpsI family protein